MTASKMAVQSVFGTAEVVGVGVGVVVAGAVLVGVGVVVAGAVLVGVGVVVAGALLVVGFVVAVVAPFSSVGGLAPQDVSRRIAAMEAADLRTHAVCTKDRVFKRSGYRQVELVRMVWTKRLNHHNWCT
jgi:hypothetical protein